MPESGTGNRVGEVSLTGRRITLLRHDVDTATATGRHFLRTFSASRTGSPTARDRATDTTISERHSLVRRSPITGCAASFKANAPITGYLSSVARVVFKPMMTPFNMRMIRLRGNQTEQTRIAG